MKDDFLNINFHFELASYFGLTYTQLAKIIYNTEPIYKYHQFHIPKKNGGKRKINSPSKKLKAIQLKLKNVLYEIYLTKPSVHGFAKNKSIVTNSQSHLDKRYVFNIDINDFFGSIHFGRVRNLFKSSPFNFNHNISTILAQICCFENALPQGAPTSPIISNMIAWKLDSQLQYLAKNTNCTYTRYADDISFSFTCNKKRLPKEIVKLRDDYVSIGDVLLQIIEQNGFSLNFEKTRLYGKYCRMEVTGITVNEFPNVRRKYIRQISSMLYAWRKFGYENAEKEYIEKYENKHRASGNAKSYLHVLKGKLAFLRSVRGGRDAQFTKLASQFNDLVDENNKFRLIETTDPEQNAVDSLWVIEVCYDDKNGEIIASQGTGFDLKDIGIITCAHVVSENKEILENIQVYKHSDVSNKFDICVEKICYDRDVAICSIKNSDEKLLSKNNLELANVDVEMKEKLSLLGFPAYAPGQSHFIVDTNVAKIYPQSTFNKFEIDKQIREGNSGGPIINSESKVVGIAIEGAKKESGNNGCLMKSELEKFIYTE